MGLIILTVIVLWPMVLMVKEDQKNIIDSAFHRDVDKRLKDIEECGYSESDGIIDDFEEKWKGYVDRWKLRHYIGKLIEKQHEKLIS